MKKYVFEARIIGTCHIIVEANSQSEAEELYEQGHIGSLIDGSEEWEYRTLDGRGESHFSHIEDK